MAMSPPRHPDRRAARGFTLIEMVVVVLIVSVLASAAMPLAALHKQRTREHELREALRTLRTAIDRYKAAADEGKIERRDGDSGYPPSLEVLVAGVVLKDKAGAASKAPQRLYLLRRLPRDPFADPGLPAAQTWGLRSHASPPDAPAPGADVFDVYSRTEGAGLDGTPYRSW